MHNVYTLTEARSKISEVVKKYPNAFPDPLTVPGGQVAVEYDKMRKNNLFSFLQWEKIISKVK